MQHTFAGAGTTTAPTPLVVEGVSFRFGGVVAVDSCSLMVPAGSVTGLIGPNGAGKTTVVNMIAGVLHPRTGSITLNGHDTTHWSTHRIGAAGLVRTFQSPAEFGSLTTVENLLVGVQAHGGETLLGALIARKSWRSMEGTNVDEALHILDKLGLYKWRNDRVATLSGGQKRLVELGRAMMARPRVLLLDEPMFGLSPVVSETVYTLLKELAAKGVAILLVEHLLKAIEQLCNHVFVMVDGRVLTSGSYREVMALPSVKAAYLGAARVPDSKPVASG